MTDRRSPKPPETEDRRRLYRPNPKPSHPRDATKDDTTPPVLFTDWASI